MKCKDIELYESLYMDNMLSNEEKAEFESHISDCKHCKMRLNNLKIIIESANKIEDIELPNDFSKELRAKLEKEKVYNSKRSIFSNKKVLSVMAACILIIITSFSLVNNYLINNKNNSNIEMAKVTQDDLNIKHETSLKEPEERINLPENKDIPEQRIMGIGNIGSDQELAVNDNIEEKNMENMDSIMSIKGEEEIFKSSNYGDDSAENNKGKRINLLIAALVVVGLVTYIYVRFKK